MLGTLDADSGSVDTEVVVQRRLHGSHLGLILVAGLLVVLLTACSGQDAKQPTSDTDPETPAGAPAPETSLHTPTIRLILNDPTTISQPHDRCDVAICRHLVGLIDSAEETVDFALYGMRGQTAVLQALQQAKSRGVKVRGVVDRDSQGSNYYEDTDMWVATLGSESVLDDLASERRLDQREGSGEGQGCPDWLRPVGFAGPLQCVAYDLGDRWLLARHASVENFVVDEEGDGGPNRIMHHKFVIADGRRVWTGSANISDTDSGGYSANLVVVIDSPQIAAAYEREFEQMWAGRYHKEKKPGRAGPVQVGDARVEVFFSPQDKAMPNAVEPLIENAQHQIDVAVFFLTNKYVTADLIAAHRRGVLVRVIVDATAAANGYTKHELLREAGIPVRVENWGGKMHMKSAMIDGRWVIGDSMNWTGAGNRTNDENTLIIDSPRLARQYGNFFESIWRSIPDQWQARGARPDPESADSGSSCRDGIDNDFDKEIDRVAPPGRKADAGCLSATPPTPLPPHEIVDCVPEGYKVITGGPRGAPVRSSACQPTGPADTGDRAGCDPSYPTLCIASPPPDLECTDIPNKGFPVLRPDPHNFDGNKDGVGCES